MRRSACIACQHDAISDVKELAPTHAHRDALAQNVTKRWLLKGVLVCTIVNALHRRSQASLIRQAAALACPACRQTSGSMVHVSRGTLMLV